MSIKEAIRAACVFVAMCGILAQLACLAYQSYIFLRHGFWPELQALHAFGYILNDESLYAPKDWLGLYAMVNWLNAGFAAMLSGFAFYFVVLKMVGDD